MADLADIRVAIAAAIETVGEIQASPWMLSSPTPTSAHVFPDETLYHQASQNGCESWGLIVEVFVGLNSDVGAQQKLDAMLASAGARSVKEAIEADETLGGLVDDVTVMRTSGYRSYNLESVPQGLVLGAQWHLTVLV